MKVLSVDFDIIMAPDINLYNQFVPKINLEEIIKSHPQLVGLRADLRHYQKLINIAKERDTRDNASCIVIKLNKNI